MPVGVKRCCCVGTLWKIDPANGTIPWRSDRGTDSYHLDTRFDGSNVIIYETGADDATRGIVSKWRDDGNDVTNLWDFAPAAGNQGVLVTYSSSDGVVWVKWNSLASRLDDSDGSELTQGSVAFTATNMWEGPSGAMNIWDGHAFPMRQYDNTVTLSASTPETITQAAAIGGDAATNGFVGFRASSNRARTWDKDLAIAVTSAVYDTGYVVLYESANDDKCVMVHFGNDTLDLIDLTALTSDWQISPSWTGESVENVHARMDSSDNVYLVYPHSSGGNRLARYAASDGSEDWSVSFDSMTFGTVGDDAYKFWMLLHSSNVILIGKHQYNSNDYNVTSIAQSDGTVNWNRDLKTDWLADGQISNGYLYVCGARNP